MGFDSTLYSNIKFTNEQTAFPVFNWNFSNFPLSFNSINIWNWGGFSNFCNFGDFNFWGGWNFKPETQGKIDFSELWKQAGNVSENSDWGNAWNNFKLNNNIPSFGKQKGSSKYSFANMTRSEALSAAEGNANLEKLTGGANWTVSDASFQNDIPYARKGTSAILAKAASLAGENLVVTSALGTKNSPHVKSNSQASHYNSENPKLDLGGGLNQQRAYSLQSKLKNTGLFSRVAVEGHGDGTYHLDIQIADSAFNGLDTLA